MTVWVVEATLSSEGPCQFFQVPYTALTMILTPSPRERDSATAYREYNSVCSDAVVPQFLQIAMPP